MPYVSSFEELAREEGREEGFKQGQIEVYQDSIIGFLEVRFGAKPAPEVESHLRKMNALDDLKRIYRRVLRANDGDEAIALLTTECAES